MEYFISHIGIIFIAGAFVAACAVGWWYLTERNARLIRERAEARRKAQAEEKNKEEYTKTPAARPEFSVAKISN
ncbi:MAG: hypothetical protein IKS75_07010 [Clostridiales bacterium]|nr:hypothetical protein [Clostridiales bacterium]